MSDGGTLLRVSLPNWKLLGIKLLYRTRIHFIEVRVNFFGYIQRTRKYTNIDKS